MVLDMWPYMAPEGNRAPKEVNEENGIGDDPLRPEDNTARATGSDEQLESSMYR